MKKGKLYGIGVGPGDTELLTIKATKLLKNVDVICSPRSAESKPSIALTIIQPVLDEREDEYEIVDPLFPMIEDKSELNLYWDHAADRIERRLEKGLNVAFITLGDPTIFSTFAYVADRISKLGFEIEVVPGITSFTGCAAASGISLVEKDEILVVVPKVDDRLEKILPHADTFVIMKTSRHSEDLERIIQADEREKTIFSVQNCTMPDENIFKGFSKDKKYLTTTLVKFSPDKKD
ncbi:MAG: precorrin-2 C(20)-methyltransferase [Methanobacterium sp. ERen5]|nr:MAG: precorrin-2 C(20)-methyltransferase [Methanobacterium sp. ERen5]